MKPISNYTYERVIPDATEYEIHDIYKDFK